MILNEEKVIRKQLLKNMLYNFFVFTIIFTLFGILIFNAVKIFIYQSSNRELNLVKEKILMDSDNKVIEKPSITNREEIRRYYFNANKSSNYLYNKK